MAAMEPTYAPTLKSGSTTKTARQIDHGMAPARLALKQVCHRLREYDICKNAWCYCAHTAMSGCATTPTPFPKGIPPINNITLSAISQL